MRHTLVSLSRCVRSTWRVRSDAEPGAQLVLIVYSPRQMVEVPDADGIVRLARFEANVRAYEDGSGRGGAVLHVGGKERYEFRFERLLEMETNELGVQGATFEVRLEQPKVAHLLIDKGFRVYSRRRWDRTHAHL